MSGWRKYKLGEIGTIVGGATPSTSNAAYYGGNIPWLTPKDLSSFQDRYIERGERNITDDGLRSCSAQLLPAGSVLFSSRAPIGYVAVAKNPIATNQGFKSIVPDTAKVDSLFLYYLLTYNKGNIEAMGSGTTFKEVSGATMKNIEVMIPPLDEQKRIAGILGVLDDKIELNRRINANLEQQAQTLFKQWFIDTDSSSWESKHLGDFFKVITGKKDANFSTKNGEYPFFTCSQDILEAPEYSFDGYAILLAGNGDFNVKRYIGKFEAYQRTYVLMPFDKKYHTYLYLLIKYNLQNITGGSRGSVIKFITKGNIENFEFLFPTINFDDKLLILNNTYRVIDRNNSESTYLSQLRDTLLPKLMLGEIHV
ncbi:MAG: restriction endonuclease subunit S [Lachnospiraceae bacterium]|nr:restriction endonuclease subunit S [Lachnospiraceae bacterium]